MTDLIMNYLTQPSTWRGIIGVATAAGVFVSPEMATAIIAAGIALGGLINVARNERKDK